MADGNPFDDRTVQAAMSTAMTYAPPDAVIKAAAPVAIAAAQNAYEDTYGADTTSQPLVGSQGGHASQQQHQQTQQAQQGGLLSLQAGEHQAPPPPAWCTKFMMWIPVKQMAFLGGVAFVVMVILDFVITGPSFLGVIINILLLLFGLVAMCIEMPSWALTRKIQLRVFFWARFMSRFWGRAYFYGFMCLLTYAELVDGFVLTALAAIFMTVVAIFMLYVSKVAATKFRRMHAFLAAGTEGPHMLDTVAAKFDHYDMDQDGRIGASEINAMAKDAGRVLSNAERHAIQSFLDESCNGQVTKADFLKKIELDFAVKWL